MSDDPFGDLFDSFVKGWKSAGESTRLGTQSVKSRPSFWNPFSTWRDADQRELREFYDRIATAFNASAFNETELLNEAVQQNCSQCLQE